VIRQIHIMPIENNTELMSERRFRRTCLSFVSGFLQLSFYYLLKNGKFASSFKFFESKSEGILFIVTSCVIFTEILLEISHVYSLNKLYPSNVAFGTIAPRFFDLTIARFNVNLFLKNLISFYTHKIIFKNLRGYYYLILSSVYSDYYLVVNSLGPLFFPLHKQLTESIRENGNSDLGNLYQKMLLCQFAILSLVGFLRPVDKVDVGFYRGLFFRRMCMDYTGWASKHLRGMLMFHIPVYAKNYILFDQLTTCLPIIANHWFNFGWKYSYIVIFSEICELSMILYLVQRLLVNKRESKKWPFVRTQLPSFLIFWAMQIILVYKYGYLFD
jgi:hypothetical protein